MTTEPKMENTKDAQDIPAEKQPEPLPNLYQKQLDFYRARLMENLEKGLDRYGFGFFHSLSPEDRILIEKDMGLAGQGAPDLYNMGNAYGARGEYEEAIKSWKQALKLNPELHDAVFNIALAYELAGNFSEARKHFDAYLQTVSNPEERQRVEEHLAQMKN